MGKKPSGLEVKFRRSAARVKTGFSSSPSALRAAAHRSLAGPELRVLSPARVMADSNSSVLTLLPDLLVGTLSFAKQWPVPGWDQVLPHMRHLVQSPQPSFTWVAGSRICSAALQRLCPSSLSARSIASIFKTYSRALCPPLATAWTHSYPW